MKQRIFLLFTLLVSAWLSARAYVFIVDGITYETNYGGSTVKVTYTTNSTPTTLYPSSYSGNVTIPEKVTYAGETYSVTSIGNNAFQYCKNLTSITIPISVTFIEEKAFERCSGLTDISIPNSVTFIGSNAFSSCFGLTSVSIPNSVTFIGSEAFNGCEGLTSIIIPNSVTSIGDGAFAYCTGLTNVTIGSSVTSIGNRAFSGCTSLTSIIIPNSVTAIGYDAFSGSPWYNNQPDGLVYAGLVAYTHKGTMSSNTHLTIKDGIKGIAAYAFQESKNLTSITIPSSVIFIGGNVFYRCTGLRDIYTKYKDPIAIDSEIFDTKNYENTILHVPEGCDKYYKARAYWKKFTNIWDDNGVPGEEGGTGDNIEGDVNSDGKVDVSDINRIIDIILGL